MDQFTEGLRRFALAGVGAVSLTIDKAKEVIDQLAARGEVTAAEGQAACEELQKKMADQLDAFSRKLKDDYDQASFEDLLRRCEALTGEQKALLIEKLQAPAEAPEAEKTCEPEESASTPPAESAAGEEPTASAEEAPDSDDHISL